MDKLLFWTNRTSFGSGSWIPFPTPGHWTEQIDGTLPALQIMRSDQWTAVKIPSNYGVV